MTSSGCPPSFVRSLANQVREKAREKERERQDPTCKPRRYPNEANLHPYARNETTTTTTKWRHNKTDHLLECTCAMCVCVCVCTRGWKKKRTRLRDEQVFSAGTRGCSFSFFFSLSFSSWMRLHLNWKFGGSLVKRMWASLSGDDCSNVPNFFDLVLTERKKQSLMIA